MRVNVNMLARLFGVASRPLWTRRAESFPARSGHSGYVSDVADGRFTPAISIHGHRLFPGGTGMCVQNAPFPVGGVMILGHNYGNDLDFSRNVQSAETSWHDSVWPTCRNTYIALRRWGIEPASCFFTNFYPGYVTTRDGNGKPFSVGPHPHVRNDAFVRASRDFFVRQVRAQRPRAVLVLGTEVPPLLAPLDSRLRAWAPWRSFAALDASGAGVVRGLTIGGHTFNMCIVAHPSMPNARHRRYGDLQGAKAEDAMVRATVETQP